MNIIAKNRGNKRDYALVVSLILAEYQDSSKIYCSLCPPDNWRRDDSYKTVPSPTVSVSAVAQKQRLALNRTHHIIHNRASNERHNFFKALFRLFLLLMIGSKT